MGQTISPQLHSMLHARHNTYITFQRATKDQSVFQELHPTQIKGDGKALRLQAKTVVKE